MTDDLPFGAPLTRPNLGAAPRRQCSHPRYDRIKDPDSGLVSCGRCGKVIPSEVSTRGRRNRARGNDIERVIGKQLGLTRVGQFGGATDLGRSREPFAVSVKSGPSYFSERFWDQLKRQPVEASQTALLVVATAPGPGVKRRAMVILDLADWIALHGPNGMEPD